jgi:hypothetical protein
VWNTGGCTSWYLDASGRNTTIWPGTTSEFRRATRRVDLGEYEVIRKTGKTDAKPAGTAVQKAGAAVDKTVAAVPQSEGVA